MDEEKNTSEDIGIENQKSENKTQQVSQKASQVKDRAKQITDMAKKVSKKASSGAAKAGKAIAKIASKLGPALPWIAIAVVVIFIIIGICGFLATMPGLLTGKLKAMAQGIADWWQSLYKTEADSNVNKQDVIDAAEYIRSMGYDLIGYGFIPANELSSMGEITINEAGKYINPDGSIYSGTPGEYYDKYGICYTTGGDNEGADNTFETAGTIKDFHDSTDISRIRSYVLSNTRLFSIRNYDSSDGLFEWIHDLFVKNSDDWAKGLISLYKAKNYIAYEFYKEGEAGSITINSTSKKLIVKKGWFNNSLEFQLDGWSGRYGLSLEFLLSLHLGTMAPELASSVARTFDTEVQVYLDEIDGAQVEGYFKVDEPKSPYSADGYITKETIKQIDKGVSDDGIFDVPGWINKKDAYYILTECGIHSQETGQFACSNGASIQIKAIDGGISDGSANYNDIVSKSYGLYFTDVIDREKEEVFAQNNWKDFFANNSGRYTTYSDPESGAGSGDWKTLEHVAACLNHASRAFMDTSNPEAQSWGTLEWINEADESKKAKNSLGDYIISRPANADGVNVLDWNSFAEKLDAFVPFPDINAMASNEVCEFVMCSFREPTANIDDARRAVISLVVSRGDANHNHDMEVISYIEPSLNDVMASRSGTYKLCHEDDSSTSVCNSCEKYVEHIRDALDDIRDEDFNSYIPYIARVVDSWFRDTYFVVPGDWATNGAGKPEDGDEDIAIKAIYDDQGKKNNYGKNSGEVKLTGNNVQYVEVDNDYLQKTDEYWTKYERNTDGTYKLYYLNDNGTLGGEYSGTSEQAKEAGIKVVKKAITKTINGADTEDGWADGWTAYSSGMTSSTTKHVLEIDGSSSSALKEVAKDYESGTGYKDVFYYTMSNAPEITQKDDGRRGITNPTIKQMFKVRKYYIYDGSEEKAQAIYKDWNKLVTNPAYDFVSHYDIEGTAFYDKYHDSDYNQKVSRALEYALDDLYYKVSGGPLGTNPENDPRNKNLIGNITINKDTLNAFSILENTHTLDADYQYRDFKELIVELDYFDKEDLSDKPDEVFEWIIPDYSEKWPLRLIDKSEEYYGTLIHSDKGIEQLKTDLEIEEPDPDATGGTATADEEKITEVARATGYTEGLDVVSPVTGEVINYGTYKRVNTDFINSKSIENGTKETKATLEGQGTNVEEVVGFIQIKVLENEDIFTSTNCTGNKDIDVEKDGETKTINLTKEEIWDSYYKEYQDVCEGYVITIEGIELLYGDSDTEGVDALGELISNVDSLTISDKIKVAKTPNLADDELEIKNQAKENAKILCDDVLKAAEVISTSDGNKLYIREGTIIGKTKYSREPEFEKYSYTRVILRDEKLAIVENAEDYFDLPDYNFMPLQTDFPEKFVFWMGVINEGACEGKYDLGDSYGVTVLNDGAGNTGAFGLTSAINDIVKETYPDFLTHLQAGRVPKQEAQDCFLLVLEDAREGVLAKITDQSSLSENMLDAIVDLSHINPSQAYMGSGDTMCKRFNSRGTLDLHDFLDLRGGSNPEFQVPWGKRAWTRAQIAMNNEYYHTYSGLDYHTGTGFKKVTFLTETPWTDFCNGTPSSSIYKLE